jgi:hypothetical protein
MLSARPRLFVIAFILGTVACVPSAQADTVYTYTGGVYTICSGAPYVPPCSNYQLKGTLDLTLSLTQLASLTNFTVPFGDVGPSSITDGVVTFSSTGNNTNYFSLLISTNAASQITGWDMILSNLPVVANTFDPTQLGSGTNFRTLGSGGATTFERSNNFTSEEIVVNTSTGVGTPMGTGTGTTGFNPGGNYNPWSSPMSTPEPSTLLLLISGLAAVGCLRWPKQTRQLLIEVNQELRNFAEYLIHRCRNAFVARTVAKKNKAPRPDLTRGALVGY